MNSVSYLLIDSSALIFPEPAAISPALRHNDKGQLIWGRKFSRFIDFGFFVIIVQVADRFKKMLGRVLLRAAMLDATQRSADKQ